VKKTVKKALSKSATSSRSAWIPILILFLGPFQILSPGYAKARSGLCSDLAESASDPARALVKDVIARTLNETRMHGLDYPGLMRAVETIAKRDPTFRELSKLFDERRFTFAVDMHGTDRKLVLQDGIKNQFQTGTSGGAVSDERRNFVESEYLRIPYEDYIHQPVDLKPKSMYLCPLPGTGFKHPYTLYSEESYGKGPRGDTWLLKLDSIEHNTLFMVGDSLDRALVQRDLAGDDTFFFPNFENHMTGSDAMDHLLPLDWLKASIPFYYEQVANFREFRFVGTDHHQRLYDELKAEMGIVTTKMDVRLNHSTPDFDEAFFKRFPELKPFENLFMSPQGNYSEGLYYGRLGSENIAGLIFHETPPTPAEWEILKRKHIKVYDGRGGVLKEVPYP
jgi:hypothetical protein